VVKNNFDSIYGQGLRNPDIRQTSAKNTFLFMYIVAIAWLYVAILMAVAEATHSAGTLLGGIVTFVLYGVLPMGLVLYVMGTPARRRAIKAQESAELQAAQAASSAQPDAGSDAPGDTVAPVGKEA
jgi:hypothetical protein